MKHMFIQGRYKDWYIHSDFCPCNMKEKQFFHITANQIYIWIEMETVTNRLMKILIDETMETVTQRRE